MNQPTPKPETPWPCILAEIPTLQAPANWPIPPAKSEFVRLYRRAMTTLQRAEFLLNFHDNQIELNPEATSEHRRQQREVLDEIRSIFELVELRACPDHDQMTLDQLLSEYFA